MRILGILFVLCLSNLPSISSEDDAVYRLPKTLKPLRYFLTLEPNLESTLLIGSVVIDLCVIENTNKITLHKEDLEIDESSLKVMNDVKSEIKVSNTTTDADNEIYNILLDGTLLKDENYTLIIGNYSATMKHSIRGLYLAKYQDENGNERRLAVSDFEPTNARRAFPCFDEPALKANFQIDLIRRENYTTLSNEQLAETIDLGNGRYKDRYKETPLISTYVVAFIVLDFKSTQQTERHRIFAKPSIVEQEKLNYCLNVSVRILRELEEFLKIKYALTKVDQVALPEKSFKNGAMENWGLITYSAPFLTCSNISTTTELKLCTTYISHELSHQWFGNLVTPSWWDYVWLSESLANYFQYHTASFIEPSWELTEQYVVDSLQEALSHDDRGSNDKAVNYKISYNGEFPESWIVYQKGGALIRMARYFLTNEIFREGLHNFLEDRKFDAAEPSDFYKGLQRAVDDAGKRDLLGNLTLESILSGWMDNVGYPVVNVIRNYETGSITFEQEKFYRAYTIIKTNVKPSLWQIPITYEFSSNLQQDSSEIPTKLWLSERNITIDGNFPINEWILVNLQQAGYYRVNYDIQNWERIIRFLNEDDFETIHVINRAQLIDDAFDLAEAYKLPADIPLKLGEYLLREKNYLPFGAFFKFIEHMQSILLFQDEYAIREDFLFFGNYSVTNDLYNEFNEFDVFQEYVKHVLEGIYQHLGFQEKSTDKVTDKLNRGLVFKWLCEFKHLGCTNDVINAFAEFKNSNGNTYIPPDLQSTVFCKGIQSIDDWKFLKGLHATIKDEFFAQRISDALACSKKFNPAKYI